MNNIIFPKHHKHSQQTFSAFSTSTTTTAITEKLLEEIVFKAYIHAKEILSDCGISVLDSKGKVISFEEVNRLAYKKLARSKCRTSKKKSGASNNDEEQDEEGEEENENYQRQQLSEHSSGNDAMDDNDELLGIDELDLDILPS
ncbi:unnamed protein product, partial [Rotaria sp. Silwood2]